ncbi:hypothetical protein RR46_11994 [Papilio xuthus]|uniref:Uncharacterized protein n=1 Tax=Papilio xuthus TaxID=66420 RepID=A0A194PV31_PAPXU|nr:hypothetical protein RR46_11994 [Papilio xuthus]
MADDSSAECLFERLRVYQQRSHDATEVARNITARINSRLTSHVVTHPSLTRELEQMYAGYKVARTASTSSFCNRVNSSRSSYDSNANIKELL